MGRGFGLCRPDIVLKSDVAGAAGVFDADPRAVGPFGSAGERRGGLGRRFCERAAEEPGAEATVGQRSSLPGIVVVAGFVVAHGAALAEQRGLVQP